MATVIVRPASDERAVLTVFGSGTHYGAVNDTTAVDDSSIYKVGSSDWDQFGLSAHGLAEGTTINSVTVMLRIAANTSGNQQAAMYQIAGAVGYGAYFNSATTSTYANNNTVWALNPDTGLAWTITDLNALRIGVWLDTAGGVCWCSQIYVTIDYNAPASGFIPKVIMI